MSITKIALISNNNLEVRVYYDKSINKTKCREEKIKECKLKEKRDFIFYSNADLNYFVFLLKKNIFNLKGEYISIETISLAK